MMVYYNVTNRWYYPYNETINGPQNTMQFGINIVLYHISIYAKTIMKYNYISDKAFRFNENDILNLTTSISSFSIH